MKNKIITVFIIMIMASFITGCSQVGAKSFGGDMTIELEPNQKLEMITWKDTDLWYLTRHMTENDVAETHVFQEDSTFGVLEGTITIVESKTE